MNTQHPFDWDDDLLRAAREGCSPQLKVYRVPHAAVVLGRGSQLEIEVDEQKLLRDGVPVLRRRGGGCSVVLDTGNVIASYVLPLPGLGGIREAFRMISGWVMGALDRVGVSGVSRAGLSDLAIGERKIGGSCVYRTQGLLYYSTTLLFQPNLDLVERYLKHPPREPGYRSGRTHRDFMGSLADFLPSHDIDSFATEMNFLFARVAEEAPVPRLDRGVGVESLVTFHREPLRASSRRMER